MKKKSAKSTKPAKAADKSLRQKVTGDSYNMAVKMNWTITDAASWATKEYGNKINKAEIQYWAMKNNLPYLDEMQNGVRVKIS